MTIFDGNEIIIGFISPKKLHQPENFKIECSYHRSNPPDGYVSLIYVLEGKSEYKYENLSFVSQKGDIVYLDNYNPFKQRVIEDYLTYTINFHIKSGFNKKPYIFHPDNTEKFLLKFREVVHASKKKLEAGSALVTTGLLYQILGEIQHELSISRYSSNKEKIFANSKSYIKENLSDINLTIETVAKKAGISPGYLRTIFKQFTYMSPSEYIKTARINYGADLLSSGSYMVNEIAKLCGFLSVSHFIKEFKKKTGCTPLNFKNNNQAIYHSIRVGIEESKSVKNDISKSNN